MKDKISVSREADILADFILGKHPFGTLTFKEWIELCKSQARHYQYIRKDNPSEAVCGYTRTGGVTFIIGCSCREISFYTNEDIPVPSGFCQDCGKRVVVKSEEGP